MTRAESFVLVLGLLGLAADLLAIVTFFVPSIAAASPTIERTGILFGSMLYGWFIVSWLLVRRYFVVSHKKRQYVPLFPKVRDTVGGIGICLLPLQYVMLASVLPSTHAVFALEGRQANPVEWSLGIFFLSAISLAVIGALIWLALISLLPVIYEDIRVP